MRKWPWTQQYLSTGELGERLAQAHYKKLGYTIVGANVFNRTGKRLGEVDFIATYRDVICFVEVKTRTGTAFGGGLTAVNWSKQAKLLKAVKLFLQNHPRYQTLRPQIDVCVIELDQLDKSLKNVSIYPNAVEDRN